ncbi:MAG: MlaC/ttg2D family ABC transporter substrate-binding protein [Alphaproteobacteria bacterium]
MKIHILLALVLSTSLVVPAFAFNAPAPARAQSALMLQAANTAGAQSFITQMTSNAISFLGDTNLTDTDRQAEFRKLLNSSYDMETIGRFSLGRYWKTATPAQRAEYQKLFKNMIVEVYSRRFRDYNGQKVEVRSVKPDADGKDSIVTSFIVPESGQEIQVDWRVRDKGGSFKVVDVIVQGVSMALTQRADFASVIQRGGGDINVLIEHLRNPQNAKAPS